MLLMIEAMTRPRYPQNSQGPAGETINVAHVVVTDSVPEDTWQELARTTFFHGKKAMKTDLVPKLSTQTSTEQFYAFMLFVFQIFM